MILKSVISLRAFNHEFTRFEKKALPMERFDNKNTLTLELFYLKNFPGLLRFIRFPKN